MTDSLNLLSATQAARGIATGDFTSVELVQACLQRIAEREETVKAWSYLHPEQALAQAQACDRQASKGVLHGVPVGIKDIIETADMPTTYGSDVYIDHQAEQDAECIQLLRHAGAVIMGKTVTTEFAFYAPGKTANPHAIGHTPGGSSSGSAAAVADFHVPVALGTQTAGSIIRPASYTGTIGYKPTYAMFSTRGIHPLAPAMDTLGGFSRSVADIALMKHILTARPPATVSANKPATVAFIRSPVWEQAARYMQQSVLEFVAKLDTAGVKVIERDDNSLAGLTDLQMSLLARGAYKTLCHIADSAASKMKPQTLALIKMGADIEPGLFAQLSLAKEVAEVFLQQVFSEADMIITPAAMAAAPAGLAATGDPVFNRIWTLLELPCINLPHSQTSSGLPLGIQLVGQHGLDHALLEHAQYCAELIHYQFPLPR